VLLETTCKVKAVAEEEEEERAMGKEASLVGGSVDLTLIER
jgi:hypothetical protein